MNCSRVRFFRLSHLGCELIECVCLGSSLFHQPTSLYEGVIVLMNKPYVEAVKARKKEWKAAANKGPKSRTLGLLDYPVSTVLDAPCPRASLRGAVVVWLAKCLVVSEQEHMVKAG